MHECTTGAGQDAEKLFDTYLDEALIQSRKFCKESIDFEFEDKAFGDFVFGTEFMSWETESKSREEKFTTSMAAPLTLGRGSASKEQIESCFLNGITGASEIVTAAAGRCHENSSENRVDPEMLKMCLDAKGVDYAEPGQKIHDYMVGYASDNCVIRFNYRLTAKEIQNWTLDSEILKREAELYRALIRDADSK